MFIITFLVPHHFYSVSFEETLVGKDRSRAVKIRMSKQTYIRWGTLNVKLQQIQQLHVFNPLSPSIHIQILQTNLYTFPYRIS